MPTYQTGSVRANGYDRPARRDPEGNVEVWHHNTLSTPSMNTNVGWVPILINAETFVPDKEF